MGSEGPVKRALCGSALAFRIAAPVCMIGRVDLQATASGAACLLNVDPRLGGTMSEGVEIRERSLLLLAALGFLTATGVHAQQQPITAALNITDPTGGVLESEFRRQFRSIGDVRLLTSDEAPQFVISVVATCDVMPCSSTHAYSVAVVLRMNLDGGSLNSYEGARRRAVMGDSADVGMTPSQIAHPLGEVRAAQLARLMTLSGVSQFVTMWSLHWPRQQYQTGVAELVGIIDAKCFEQVRLQARARSFSPGTSVETRSAAIEQWLALQQSAGMVC